MKKDPNTTLFLRNLPFNLTNKQLNESLTEISGVKHAFVAKSHGKNDKNSGIGFVMFKTADDALKAHRLLQNFQFEDRTIIAEFAKEEKYDGGKKNAKKPPTEEQKVEKKKEENQLNATRELIVRNLSFNVDEAKLVEIFSKYGKVLEARIPLDSKKKKRGFAFVKFKTSVACDKALEGMQNQKIDDRVVVIDKALGNKEFKTIATGEAPTATTSAPTVSKAQSIKDIAEQALQALKNKTQRLDVEEEQPQSEDEASEEESEEESDNEEDKEEEMKDEASDDSDAESLAVSVDEEGKIRFIEDDNSAGEESSNEEEESDDDEEEILPIVNKHVVFDNSDDEEGTTVQNAEKNSEQKGQREMGHDVEEQKTLFIRNVPFNATEENVREVLEKYGKILFVKLVKGDGGEGHRGVGFVKFTSKYPALKILEEEKLINDKINESSGINAARISKVSGKRAADMSQQASLDIGICLFGRRLIFSLAIKPAEAESIKNNNAEKKKQRKNIHLLECGDIEEGSKEYDDMTATDKKRRQEIKKEMKKRSENPNITINSLRLLIQNLPVHVTNLTLRTALEKTLASDLVVRKAVFEEKKEEKWEGLREWIYKKDSTLESLGKGNRKNWFALMNKVVEKVNVMSDSNRTVVNGEGEKVKRCLGYAFIDISSETLAMKILNGVNNSALMFGANKRPIVHFAMEDVRALRVQQKRQEVMEKRREKREKKKQEEAEQEGKEEVKEEKGKAKGGKGAKGEKGGKAGKNEKTEKAGKAEKEGVKRKREKKDMEGDDEEKKLSRGQRQRLKKRQRQMEKKE